MNVEHVLKTVGLDERQSSVYLSALELGETSITELAKKANLKRPTTYLIMDDLLALGLISETKKGKRRVISATHPRRLLNIVRSREEYVEEALPELVALYNTPEEKPTIQVFEGAQGIRDVYKDLFSSAGRKEELLFITNIGALLSIPGAGAEFKKLVRHKSNPKVRELNYKSAEAVSWAKEIKKLKCKNHSARLLTTQLPFGNNDIVIFGNKVALFSLKKNVFVIVIESPDLAQTFRVLFEVGWKVGRSA